MPSRARKTTSELIASKKDEVKRLKARVNKLQKEIKVLELKESDIYTKKIMGAVKKSKMTYEEILSLINQEGK